MENVDPPDFVSHQKILTKRNERRKSLPQQKLK